MIFFVFFAGLAFILLGLKIYTDIEVRKAEKRCPPLGNYVTVHEVRLHYVRAGTGRPVVFIHGSFGSAYDGLCSIFETAKARYDTLLFDRPGHGYSGAPRKKALTLFEQARYLRDALAALGIEKPVLVGHSLGATVTLAFALEFPEAIAGIVLVSPYTVPWAGPTDRIHTWAAVPVLGEIYLHCLLWPVGNRLKKSIGERVFSPATPPEDYLAGASGLAMRPAHFRANAADICGLRPALRTMQERWKEVRVPAAILAGDSDLIARQERHARPLAQAVRGSRLLVLKGIGHQPLFNAPAQVLEAVDWVWGTDPARSHYLFLPPHPSNSFWGRARGAVTRRGK